MKCFLQRARNEHFRLVRRGGHYGEIKYEGKNDGIAYIDADADVKKGVQREVNMIVLGPTTLDTVHIRLALVAIIWNALLTLARKEAATAVDLSQEAQRYRAVHRPISPPRLSEGISQTFCTFARTLDRQRKLKSIFRRSYTIPKFSIEQAITIQAKKMQ